MENRQFPAVPGHPHAHGRYFFASRDWTAFERGGVCIVEDGERSFPDTRVEIWLSPVLYGNERDFMRKPAHAHAGKDAVDQPV